MAQLTKATAKLALHSAASLRRVAAEIETTVMMPPEGKIARTALHILEEAEWKSQREEQSASSCIWHAIVSAMIEIVPNEADKKFMTEYAKRHTSRKDCHAVVKNCFVSLTHKKDWCKIVFTMAPTEGEMRRRMIAAFEHAGGDVKLGPLPKSGAEREVQRYRR
jgi:hypothetical protein